MIYRTALRLIGRSAWAAPAVGDDPLRDMAADIARRHPGIDHMLPSTLAAKLATTPASIVLFDVREPREFAVSHLAGAVLVSPRGASALEVVRETLALHPEAECAVFYCAVGVRSSALASRFMLASDRSNIGVANLEGGLFRWANDGRPLVDGEGATTAVHLFNRHWSRFLAQGMSTLGRDNAQGGTGEDAYITRDASN
jgi:rhodanese-related sulfurtransferase